MMGRRAETNYPHTALGRRVPLVILPEYYYTCNLQKWPISLNPKYTGLDENGLRGMTTHAILMVHFPQK
jgi:hypothetical protein